MKKRNWKADEMEMSINFKAMRISWVFTQIALLIYSIIEFIKTDEIPYWAWLILCVANLIFFCAKSAITNKMTKDGADDEEQD